MPTSKRPGTTLSTLLPLLCLVLAGALAGEEIVPAEVGDTPNLSHLPGEAYFGGQPSAEDLKSFAELGVKTVVNLRTEQEVAGLGFDEESVVKEAGMTYVHVPIGREEPSAETLEKLMALLGDAANRPLLMHCASSNRVGYVWSLFRGTEGGQQVEAALAEGKAAGLRSSALESRARAYLEEN